MEVEGIVVKLLSDQEIKSKKNDETYRKRQFLLEYKEGKYSNQVAMEIFGKANGRMPQISVGNKIKVTFSVTSNEWEGRYFTKASAIFIEILDMSHASGADYWLAGNEKKPAGSEQLEMSVTDTDVKTDDLPF